MSTQRSCPICYALFTEESLLSHIKRKHKNKFPGTDKSKAFVTSIDHDRLSGRIDDELNQFDGPRKDIENEDGLISMEIDNHLDHSMEENLPNGNEQDGSQMWRSIVYENAGTFVYTSHTDNRNALWRQTYD